METPRNAFKPPALPVFAPVPELDEAAYERMARDVRSLLGIDLAQYKPAQVWRRVHGFAAARGFSDPDALIGRARQDSVLRQAFMDMLTINVSEFFRNPEAWDAFASQILRPVVERQPSVRIWSAGCSLGYEPLTIAMISRELGARARVTILATDLDETTLARARQTTYTEIQMAGISELRRTRFFRPNGAAWEAVPDLRSMISWQRQDLLRDEFGSGFDVISCRNVVIYFTEAAKAILYERFRQALRPGGILFLGATESIPNPRASGFIPAGLTFYRRPES